jgi:hypothetical protein
LLQLARADDGREIEERPGRSSDRDPAEPTNVPAVELGDTVDTDPALRLATPATHGDFDLRWSGWVEPPEKGCAAMADHCAPTKCEHSPELPGTLDWPAVADHIDAAVQRAEALRLEAIVDRVGAQPDGTKLGPRDDATLPGCQFGHRPLAADGAVNPALSGWRWTFAAFTVDITVNPALTVRDPAIAGLPAAFGAAALVAAVL